LLREDRRARKRRGTGERREKAVYSGTNRRSKERGAGKEILDGVSRTGGGRKVTSEKWIKERKLE